MPNNSRTVNLLSALEVALNYPTVLKEGVLPLIVTKIDPLSSITNDEPSTWILSWTISDQFL